MELNTINYTSFSKNILKNNYCCMHTGSTCMYIHVWFVCMYNVVHMFTLSHNTLVIKKYKNEKVFCIIILPVVLVISGTLLLWTTVNMYSISIHSHWTWKEREERWRRDQFNIGFQSVVPVSGILVCILISRQNSTILGTSELIATFVQLYCWYWYMSCDFKVISIFLLDVFQSY